MKSAYELAMERLDKVAPVTSLTNDQRKEIGDIETRFKAKIAEKEVFLQGLIAQAEAQGDLQQSLQLKQQLAAEISQLNVSMEEAKEEVRKN